MNDFNQTLKDNFEKLLDFQLEDSKMTKMVNNDIDLSNLIDFDDNELKQFGIKMGRNNFKNDICKINSIVKEVQNGFGLENSVIEKLLENNINFDRFLSFEKNDFKDYSFNFGISSRLAQKVKIILSIRQEESKKIESKINFKELKKLLSSQNQPKDKFDEDFNRIIIEDLDVKFLKNILISKKSVSLQLKPFLIDNLKRIKRFNSVISKLNEIAYDNTINDTDTKKILKMINEKDLVICLLESICSRYLGRLGYLLSKNDYPLPLFYQVYDHEKGELEEKVNFEIMSDFLCLTNASLAIVSGTASTIRQGKSMLIPFMFSDFNSNSVYKMRQNSPIQNSIDIVCNEELNDSWVIADFNGELVGKTMLNLFKSFTAFASTHVMNVNLSDFDQKSGEPNNEVIDILNNYKKLKTNFSNDYNLELIFLIHYNFDEDNLNLIQLIETNLKAHYMHISILTVDNLFDSGVDREILKIKKEKFKKNIQLILNKLKNRKFKSIFDIKLFYEKIQANDQNCTIYRQENWIEKELKELFCVKNSMINYEAVSKMFELSNIYKEIEICENKLIDLFSQQTNSNTSEINKKIGFLKQKLQNIEPKNEILKFFIKILECDENFLINLSIFEKCIFNFKIDELKKLRKERETISNEISIMDNQIKFNKTINHQDFKRMKEKLFQLDEKIKIVDLTLDNFWNELFLYLDLLDETKKPDDGLKNLIIDRFLKLIRNGHSIHLLRGSPLSVKSNILKDIMNRLDYLKNIYVISVIGEQSSAKSSLLNSLFGCDFRTSAGRCTIGIYMNFVTYGDNTIVILDTEGLASIESSNKLFDNQMATMSVFSSHQILINHKGEISSNLENILGITFFAKLNLTNYSFKPSIFFVLRDQLDRSESSINTQVSKLKERLIKQSEFIKTSLDNVLDIDTNYLTLLSCAFSEFDCPNLNKSIKMRNSIFPDQVLQLRKKLIYYMNSIEKKNLFENMSNLYLKLNSNWDTISKTGRNIFNCKDLEELKIRDEISAKAHDILGKHRDNLEKKIGEKLMEIIENFTNHQVYDMNTEIKCNKEIKILISNVKELVLQQFDSETDFPFYSKSVKDEYKNLISYQFQWIENISIHRLNENCIYIKNRFDLDNANENITREINNLLNSNIEHQNEYFLIENVTKRLNDIQNDNFIRLQKMIKPKEQFIEEIEILFHNKISLFRSTKKLNGIENKLNLIEYFEKNFHYNTINFEDYFELWSPKLREIYNKVKHTGKRFNLSQNEIKLNINKWCENLIIDFDQIYLSNLMEFHITERFIHDILVFLDTNLSNQDSIVNKYHLDFCRVFNSLIKHFLFLVARKFDQNQKSNNQKEKEKYKNQKNELIEKTKKIFKLKSDSKKLGSSIADDFISKIFDNLIEIETFSIINSCKEKINKKFKTPNELVEYAFQMSFEACNYDQVFKYVIDVNRYCEEVCFENIKSDLKILININQDRIKDLYTQFLEFLMNVHLKNDISSCSEFFENLKNEAQSVNQSLASLFKTSDSIIGTEIKDIDLFVRGFKESIGQFYEKIDIKLKEFNDDLDKKCNSEIKNYIHVYLGCNARCPCCGSKCEKSKGHEGDHCSNFHILKGFFGWGNKDTNKVTTFFCWEETNFKKLKFYLGQKEFNDCTDFLVKEHPDWLSDITKKYEMYGKNVKNSGNIIFRNQIIRAWMNTRKPLLKKYKRLDKEYDDAWISMEDSEKMLKDDHTANSYEKF